MRKTPRRLAEMFFTASTSMVLTVGCGDKSKDAKPDDLKPNVAVEPAKANPAEPSTPETAKETSNFLANVLVIPPDPGETTTLPPDVTYAKKGVAHIFEAIKGTPTQPGLWDQVRFVDGQGRKVQHFAVVQTDKGNLRIELLGDAAPNHVRNFVALARAGYFDGLPFHKSVRDESGARANGYLETGCPKGTGEFGHGSIGYWLRPEIKEDLLHTDGTVGAWSSKDQQTGEDLANAACKFYINLGHTKGLDGNYTIFGKVVQGLDVAHTINRTQVKDVDLSADSKNLIHVRRVTIEEIVDGSQVAAK